MLKQMKKVRFSPNVTFFEHDIKTRECLVLIKLSRIADNNTIPISFLMRYERLLKPVFGSRRQIIFEERFKNQ